MKLHVIFADINARNLDLSTQYRHVEIQLTPEQIEELKPRWVGRSGGSDAFELIDSAFIEETK